MLATHRTLSHMPHLTPSNFTQAGKLGIVIDTTLEGPVVNKINPKSPLQGFLFPGDIIVAVDNVDTRAMPASAITALMVRTSGVRRKLTVLSEDNGGE
jgi:C-terminal processing protease CtpA/Prc